MKRINHKIIIYIIILALSMTIFIFAFSVLLTSKKQDGRDIKTFSYKYIICEFRDTPPGIKEAENKIDAIEHLDIAFMQISTRNIYLNFNDAFYKEILHNKADSKIIGDVYINSKSKRQCYEEDGKKWVVLDGTKLSVAGFYDDDKYASETGGSYINLKSKQLENYNNYNFFFIDMGDEVTDAVLEKTVKQLENIFPETDIRAFNGKREGVTDGSDRYVTFLVLMGIIICFNCMDFTDIWFNYYYDEIKIRKLVGADKWVNIKFLLKKFFTVFSVSAFAGIILSFVIKTILDTEKLIMLGSLLCQQYGLLTICMGVVTVFIFAILIIGLIAFCRVKERRIKNG